MLEMVQDVYNATNNLIRKTTLDLKDQDASRDSPASVITNLLAKLAYTN